MAMRKKYISVKLSFYHRLAHLLGATAFLFVIPLPVHADVVYDIKTEIETAATAVSSAATEVSSGITAVNTAILPYQNAWAKDIDAVNSYLQTQIAGLNVDTASNNNRINTNLSDAQAIAREFDEPASKNYCAENQSDAAFDDLHQINGAVAQAMSNGGSNRPDTPATIAADLAAYINSGLAPCSSSGQTEYATDKTLKCTPKFGGRWERADRSMAALFANDGIPVPPDYVPAASGQPQTIPIETSEKYMPFVAALRYCQRLGQRLPQAPQMNQPTVGVLAMDPYGDMEAAASTAYTDCTRFFTERLQYGTGVNKVFQNAHKDQATACTADAQVGYNAGDPQYTFADGSTGSCQTDGRSELQRIHDQAFRNDVTNTNYGPIYLQGYDRKDTKDERDRLRADRNAYYDHVSWEHQELTNAIQASNDAVKIYSSTLDQPLGAGGH